MNQSEGNILKISLWFTSILCPTYWYWGQQVLANLWSCKVLVVALSCEGDTWPRQGKFCASYNVKYLWWFYMSKQAHILCVKYIIHIRTWEGVLKTFFLKNERVSRRKERNGDIVAIKSSGTPFDFVVCSPSSMENHQSSAKTCSTFPSCRDIWTFRLISNQNDWS